ncbi:mfs phs inorganic phosphate transporter [Stemphylium lycopersici]|uniref:Mfs phs inorganic phosphate transporter n=1 Tax=Stemphylium lycopersici TaxID=183478 RepID=A0A364N3P0_STELY|nr:mfs phs inorganic phosphate transporter [Stemphylium lycopersici]RAR11083.1 mfs phs inorganic phosphate transporter [Stemphylium lycopersici]
MSFGCSPSDVLKLLEISTRVYLAFKDANENSEAQVAGLVKEFTSFHGCLIQLGDLMKQYGQPMPFPVKDFEATLKRCEKTLDPYADNLVDKKMGVKKIFFTIRYMGMEKEIDGLRKQITGHYQALHMCISFLQLRLHLEATKQTQRLLDEVPSRTVTFGGRSYSENVLVLPSQHSPLPLPAPDEHPLYSEWKIFDRWLQSEDRRIAEEAKHSRPLSLGNTPAVAPGNDEYTAAILYHLRQQVDDAILLEENRAKRMPAEKRSHLAPSDAMRQEVRNMPQAPTRTYTLDTDHSGNFTGFQDFRTSSYSSTVGPGPCPTLSPTSDPNSPHAGPCFGLVDWEQPPTNPKAVQDTGRSPSILTQSSMSCPPASPALSSGADVSTTETTPEILTSPNPRNSLSRASLATIALGGAALEWKTICRSAEVERKSVKHGAESRECDILWRYREDTGISLCAVYHSSKDGKLRPWIEQGFLATGPSIPLTTTYADGAVSIDFPRGSFGKLDKQYTDVKYTFAGYDSAKKFQTLLYTNNGSDPAVLHFDRPIVAISSNKNSTECRGRNLRLWLRPETHLEDDGPVTFDVLVLLFYTSALGDKGHWVEEPHYAFEWLADATYKKDSDKLKLVFSKNPTRWKTDKLSLRRKSSSTCTVPKSPFVTPRKRNDSMEIPDLTRSATGASALSNSSNKSTKSGLGSRDNSTHPGNLNRFGYSELDIKFHTKKDRRAFLDIWKEYFKPLSKAA